MKGLDRLVLVAGAMLVYICPRPLPAQLIAGPLALMHHDHWSATQGLPTSDIGSMQRTPDGYLWIGSRAGLIRFDGMRFVTMDSTRSPVFQRRGVPLSRLDASHPVAARKQGGPVATPLMVDRTGTMWVATSEGALLRYSDRAFAVAVQPNAVVGRFNIGVEDGAGRLWLVASEGGCLYNLRDGRLVPPDLPAGVPASQITSIVADTASGIWIATMRQGLWHISAAGAEHLLEPAGARFGGTRILLQARDGALWVARGGTFQVRDRRWTPVLTAAGEPIVAIDAVEMSDGSVALATRGMGLARSTTTGVVDLLGEADGLSSESVKQLQLDGEGSLWISTDAGLDRLRTARFTTISRRNGLPTVAPASLQFDGDGSLWIMSSAVPTLYRVDVERLLARRPAVLDTIGRPPQAAFYAPIATMPGHGVLLRSNRGTLAIAVGSRVTPVVASSAPAPSPENPTAALIASNGTLWLAFKPATFGRVVRKRFVPLHLADAENRVVSTIAEDARGNLWLGFADTALVMQLDRERIKQRIPVREPIQKIVIGHGDTVWAIGAGGLLHQLVGGTSHAFDIPAITRLLDGAAPTVVPADSQLWLASSLGIAQISYAALARYGTPQFVRDSATPEVFDQSDGLSSAHLGRMVGGGVVTDRAGRLWFSTMAGLAVVTPSNPARNSAKPRVLIEDVTAAGTFVGDGTTKRLAIAPNADRVDIRYTATGLRAPERVRVEYRLVGSDAVWHAATAARVASYTQLAPGDYEFRVRAWNEDGVPGANEASLTFTVLPAWYQQAWFVAVAFLAIAGGGAGIAYAQQRVRTRIREDQLRSRFEATLEERTRLAREVHDTILSGFTGITMQLQSVQRMIVASPQQAAREVTRLLNAADTTLREARQIIWDMRHADEPRDLVATIEKAAEAAVANTLIEVRLAVRGDRHPLPASLETTLLRVAREAVLNAVKHAEPRVVHIELSYKADCVELVVRDDGRGLAATNAETAIAEGHWGISGMRERAKRVGGTLNVSSRSGLGTSVTVLVPIHAGRHLA